MEKDPNDRKKGQAIMGIKPNRRDLLKLIGHTAAGVYASTPLQIFLSSIALSGLSKVAHSAESPRRWVDLKFDFAPPRWVYDLLLTPYDGGATFVANPGLGTRYVAVGGRYVDVQYATVVRYGIRVPWLWQFPIPRPGGATAPMADLLPYFLNIRGIDTNNAGHAGSQQLHYLPLGATQSVSAFSADLAVSPLAAVYYGVPSYIFRSLATRSANAVTGTNLVESLMSPFISRANGVKEMRRDMDQYLGNVRSELNALALDRHPFHSISTQTMVSTRELMMGAFNDLTQQWSDLLAKYSDLVSRALDPGVTLIGINDREVGVSTVRGNEYAVNNIVVRNSDLRSMIDAQTTVGRLAEIFAMVEYILMNELSSSVTAGIGLVNGINANGARIAPTFDEHFTGKMTSVYINTYLARAHAACLLELIKQLEGKGMFKDTVINCSGEFNRSPRNNGTGSDHGFRGASLALYSGAIKGPIVLGNVAANAPDATHSGTWGYGAPIAGLGGQILDVGHAAATIATLLRAESPLISRRSVVDERSENVITPAIELGKLV